jgi:hypothetical protein
MASTNRVGKGGMTALLVGLGVCLAAACGSDDEGDPNDGSPPDRPEDTGAACEFVDDCYPDVEPGAIVGDVECLDRVRDGYCTHTCQDDTECCAVEGECDDRMKQVCSPFENSTVTRCFVSCESDDLYGPPEDPDAAVDEQEFCQREASPDFICRSSGGGTDNRKICVPGDCGVGASCAVDGDCTGDLACLTAFGGGYCGRADCTGDADCPDGAVCVVHGDGNNYCMKTCATNADCSFCRRDGTPPTCTDSVEFVEATGVTVCAPAP